jgi:hypothetical protein
MTRTCHNCHNEIEIPEGNYHLGELLDEKGWQVIQMGQSLLYFCPDHKNPAPEQFSDDHVPSN